jgi:aryl-alcohol dehydrogenase-like predicted oxidoreductase
VYPGASNFAAWQIEKALGVSSRHGWAPFEVIEPMYNLVKRQAEVEILPMAQAENLGVIAYNPIGGGLLTGKYGRDGQGAAGRLKQDKSYTARYGADWMFDVGTQFADFARARGYEPAALAVAWVASHPAVTAPIVGARNAAQLSQSLRALEITMTPELRAEISALAPEPPPATDRNDERTPFAPRMP